MWALEDIYRMVVEMERHAAAIAPTDSGPIPTRSALLYNIKQIQIQSSRIQLAIIKIHPTAPAKVLRLKETQ
jgi:hypothetical protein